jgi:hypothetical protein
MLSKYGATQRIVMKQESVCKGKHLYMMRYIPQKRRHCNAGFSKRVTKIGVSMPFKVFDGEK